MHAISHSLYCSLAKVNNNKAVLQQMVCQKKPGDLHSKQKFVVNVIISVSLLADYYTLLKAKVQG